MAIYDKKKCEFIYKIIYIFLNICMQAFTLNFDNSNNNLSINLQQSDVLDLA